MVAIVYKLCLRMRNGSEQAQIQAEIVLILAVLYPNIQTCLLVLMGSVTIMNSRHHFERYLDSGS